MPTIQEGTAEPIVVSWSGGKDSALALDALSRDPELQVVGLLTSVTSTYDRVSVHGVRRSMLEAQVERLGLPLFEIPLSPNCSNEAYEAAFHSALDEIRRERPDVTRIAFGDLFLEDIRNYREVFLARHNMRALFPVWKRDTTSFIKEFIELGFKAVVTCVDSRMLDQSFAGRMIDNEFVSALPGNVDPCGENGEFHSFVVDGPMFAEPLRFSWGETVSRNSFWFRDLLPQ